MGKHFEGIECDNCASDLPQWPWSVDGRGEFCSAECADSAAPYIDDLVPDQQGSAG